MASPSQPASCDTPACCCMDIGTVIDGNDCNVNLELLRAADSSVEQVLAELQQRANNEASEPVTISHQLQAAGDQQRLAVTLTFPCQAEALIFQLKNR
jgi:uncharacterized protein (TIGR00743 family)